MLVLHVAMATWDPGRLLHNAVEWLWLTKGEEQVRVSDLDDRSDELYEEARQLHERWIEGMEVVHDQALDMGAIMVLVCHDHQVAIAKLLDICVHLPHGEHGCDTQHCLITDYFPNGRSCAGKQKVLSAQADHSQAVVHHMSHSCAST